MTERYVHAAQVAPRRCRACGGAAVRGGRRL